MLSRLFARVEGIYDLSLSAFHFITLHIIISKIERAGATSKEKAVTIEEAESDLQERQWLNYFAGAFLSEIKKTKNVTSRNKRVAKHFVIVFAV